MSYLHIITLMGIFWRACTFESEVEEKIRSLAGEWGSCMLMAWNWLVRRTCFIHHIAGSDVSQVLRLYKEVIAFLKGAKSCYGTACHVFSKLEKTFYCCVIRKFVIQIICPWSFIYCATVCLKTKKRLDRSIQKTTSYFVKINIKTKTHSLTRSTTDQGIK